MRFTAELFAHEAEVDESVPENPIAGGLLDISGRPVEEDAIATSIAEISAVNMPLNYNRPAVTAISQNL